MITNPVTPPVSHSSIDRGNKEKQEAANSDWQPHGHGQGQLLSLSLLSPSSYSLNRVYPLQSTRARALPSQSVYGLPRLRSARGWEHPQAHLRPWSCKATHLPPLGLVALPHWPRNRCCPFLHHSNISILWEKNAEKLKLCDWEFKKVQMTFHLLVESISDSGYQSTQHHWNDSAK